MAGTHAMQKHEASEPANGARLHGHWLAAARGVWLLSAASALGLLLVSIPAAVAQLGTLTLTEQWRYAVAGIMPAAPDALEFPFDVATLVVGLVSTSTYIALAALLYRRKGREPLALLFSLFLLLFGTLIIGPFQTLTDARTDWLRAGAVVTVIVFQALWFFFFVFPDGHFVPRWTRRLLPVCAAWMLGTIVFNDTLLPAGPPTPAQAALLFVWHMSFPLGGVAAQVYRYRRVSSAVERQQTKLVVFGFAAMFSVFLIVPLALTLLLFNGGTQDANEYLLLMRLFGVLYLALLSIVPLSMGAAILRYRLFDIDILIRRTLVYGSLTLVVSLIYVLAVGALSALSQTSGNLIISLLATGLIAVLFQPLRERLQRGVNRLLYGERDEPYAVLSTLGQRLEATLAPDAVLPAIVDTVAQELKLPYAAIELTSGDRQPEIPLIFSSTSVRPPALAQLVRLPLTYQNEPVGSLLLAPRAGEDGFSQADLRLLTDLARQAGIAAHAVRLTADLQRSRERIVSAREEERRRIRRDLHDGLGPSLASLTLKLDAARNLLARDPAAADTLLCELKGQSQAAISDIRRLVYDLRPPALDELGLVPALREYATRLGGDTLRIAIEAGPLPPLSAAVEVAAYRIVTEALTNVVHHAQARNALVRLSCCGTLDIDVGDDGAGPPPGVRAGVGLTSMRERAAELGGTFAIESPPTGGTHVMARLPAG